MCDRFSAQKQLIGGCGLFPGRAAGGFSLGQKQENLSRLPGYLRAIWSPRSGQRACLEHVTELGDQRRHQRRSRKEKQRTILPLSSLLLWVFFFFTIIYFLSEVFFFFYCVSFSRLLTALSFFGRLFLKNYFQRGQQLVLSLNTEQKQCEGGETGE